MIGGGDDEAHIAAVMPWRPDNTRSSDSMGPKASPVPRTTRAARYRGGAAPCTSAISSALVDPRQVVMHRHIRAPLEVRELSAWTALVDADLTEGPPAASAPGERLHHRPPTVQTSSRAVGPAISDQPDHPQRDGQGGHPASRPRASNTSHPPPLRTRPGPERLGKGTWAGLGPPGGHCPAASRNRGNDITLSDTEGRRERTPTRRSRWPVVVWLLSAGVRRSGRSAAAACPGPVIQGLPLSI